MAAQHEGEGVCGGASREGQGWNRWRPECWTERSDEKREARRLEVGHGSDLLRCFALMSDDSTEKREEKNENTSGTATLVVCK